nr:NepR family anti-sigma factor [Acetobacter conturbans]
MSARERKPSSARKGCKQEEDAFDIWLKRGLHQLFDDVAKEPIPEELLRLLEENDDED